MERTPVEVAPHVEWRVIPGFTHYSASSDGQIFRSKRMQTRFPGLVKQSQWADGYLRVSLTNDDGVQKSRLVHVLVAAAFFGPKPSGMIALHGPKGQRVNTIENLSYGTYSKNNGDDRRRDGTLPCGEKSGSSKLTDAKVREAIALLNQRKLTHNQIATLFGTDGSTIGRIAIGKTWKHIERPEGFSPIERPAHRRPRKRARINDLNPANAGLFEFRVAKAGKGAAK